MLSNLPVKMVELLLLHGDIDFIDRKETMSSKTAVILYHISFISQSYGNPATPGNPNTPSQFVQSPQSETSHFSSQYGRYSHVHTLQSVHNHTDLYYMYNDVIRILNRLLSYPRTTTCNVRTKICIHCTSCITTVHFVFDQNYAVDVHTCIHVHVSV